ncbi:hypothetical protein DC31_16115 [Microbacterium sp. CH12i]|nr:hypothetical protein DC31_16115 [Microbacterium sp. CH12i]
MIVDAGLPSSRPIARNDEPARCRSAIISRSASESNREPIASAINGGGLVIDSIVTRPVE